MDAREVKKEMWRLFGDNVDFLGASVRANGNDQYVVVRLRNDSKRNVISQVPSEMSGIGIEVEYSDPIKALHTTM